jgi:branched-chain amino acid transport system substrate-binding protein
VVVALGLVLAACGTRVPLAEREALRAARLAPAEPTAAAPTAGTRDTLPDGVAAGAAPSEAGATTTSTVTPTGGPATGPVAVAAGYPESLPTGSPVRIGAVGTLSGVGGPALQKIWVGLSIWVAWVNTHGGVAGHPVELIRVDDGGDPGRYATAVRRLVEEEHVVAFVGSIAPLTFSAATSVLEQHGVPAIGGDSSEPGWFASPMAFPIASYLVPAGRPLGVWGPTGLGKKKAATFHLSEAEVARLRTQAFEDGWKAHGGQVLVSQAVSIATVDYTSEVIQAKDAGAQVVLLDLDEASCQRFWSAARRQQYRPIYLPTGCGGPAIDQASDQTYGNAYYSNAHKPIVPGASPVADEYIAAAKRFGGPDVDLTLAAREWFSGEVFERAVVAGGGITSAAIVAGLRKLHDETLGGLIPAQSWPPGPHKAGTCGVVIGIGLKGERQLKTPEFVC